MRMADSFIWLALLAYSHSAVAYRQERVTAGDRLLFLAIAAVLECWAVILHGLY